VLREWRSKRSKRRSMRRSGRQRTVLTRLLHAWVWSTSGTPVVCVRRCPRYQNLPRYQYLPRCQYRYLPGSRQAGTERRRESMGWVGWGGRI
jgi:hypothetical protein